MTSQVIDYYIAGDDDATTPTVALAYGEYCFVAGDGVVVSTADKQAAILTDKYARLNIVGEVYAELGDAIRVGANSAITIGAAGAVMAGFEAGIRSYDGEITLNNAGTISGSTDGVILGGAANKVTNSGSITSIYGNAVSLGYGSTFVNTGDVSGGEYATVDLQASASSYQHVVNSGSITSSNDTALDVRSYADGYSLVSNSGLISAYSDNATAIFTGQGNDTVTNSGRIVGGIQLGDGDDTFDGRAGTETGIVSGEAGDDTLYGSDTGADVLEGGAGADMLYGGGGSDTASYQYSQSGVTADLADPSINVGDADGDSYSSIENLAGSIYPDTLIGDDGVNQLSGGDGGDMLDGGGGADVMIGGDGNDVYYVDNSKDKVIERDTVAGGTDTVVSFASFSLAGQGIENLILSGTLDLNATGNGLANALYGNPGNNVLDGKGGADVMTGGAGNDTYYVDNTGDNVVEADGGGTDAIYASVSYTLSGRSVETLTLTGTGAINATGNGSVNTLVGNSAANILDGQGGADTMTGGSGDDTYYVDNAGDKVVEADDGGNDTIYASVSYSLGGTAVETLALTGTGAINATGNGLANTLIGNSAANILDGKTGADTMTGGAGNDTYYVDNSGDKVIETSTGGADSVFSSASFSLAGQYIETLTLTGTASINATGNNQANTLVGNAGANVIDGKGGKDTLTGGGGADTFLFDSALSSTAFATISDFTVGTDMIKLDRAIFKAISAAGPLAGAAFYQGAAAHDADDRIIYNSSTGDIFYDADGSGSGAAVKFAHVGTGLSLTAASFTAI